MNEIKLTAADILELLKNKNKAEADRIYTTDEKLVLEADTAYYGNGMTVKASRGIEANGDNTSICDCKLVAENGITVRGDNFAIQGCVVEANACAIKSIGKAFIARNNKIFGDISLEEGSVNCLVAQNKVQGAINVNASFNCVVILNNAKSIKAEDNTNLYVIKNTLSASLDVCNNKYIICDENMADGVVSVGNSETNGDNITNITARREFGANEDILPHINKERFVGMERHETVKDITLDEPKSLGGYIRAKAAENDVVIVPPGVYKVNEDIMIGAEQSNTDIYAYGVLAEATYLGEITAFRWTKNVNISGLTWGYGIPHSGQLQVVKLLGDNKLIGVVSAGFGEEYGNSDRTKFRTSHESRRHQYEEIDYAGVSGYYDMEKQPDGSFIITFKKYPGTDKTAYEGMEVGDILMCRMAGNNSQTVTVADSENVHLKDVTMHGYAQGTHFRNQRCKDVSYERYVATPPAPFVIDEATYNKYKAWEEEYGVDLEVYIDENGRYRGSRPRIGGTGTMEVQDAVGGVNLTSCILDSGYDDGCNQRGTSARLAGFKANDDGTYTVYYKGCVSSIYYYLNSANRFGGTLGSDGLIECHPGGCASVKKGDIVTAYGSNGAVLFGKAEALEDAQKVIGSCEHWTHIDADGDDVCDICGKKIYKPTPPTTTDTITGMYPAVNASYDPENGQITFYVRRWKFEEMLRYTTNLYSIRVKADKVNPEALRGYDLLSNDYAPETQFFFDNVTRNCYKFTFDNVLIQKNRARGILIKTQDVTIKNCTFKDEQIEGLIIGKETNWGESTVPSNVTVKNCIFDNTSYVHRNNTTDVHYAPINIQGLGGIRKVVELNDNFACNNIKITHNKFINNTSRHLIYASAVKGLEISENVFEERPEIGKVLYLNGCIDVNISDNTYTERLQESLECGDVQNAFALYKYKNLTLEGEKLPDSNENPTD